MDGMVRGWLHVPGLDARPLVTVNGKPARLLAYREPRGDVCERLRIDEPTGFTFHSPGVRKGDLVELFAVTPVGIIPVVTRPAAAPSPQTEFIAQLERAREIAAKPGAVAVTIWDGGHNPVGRAMVLHDVVATHSPVVLFTYLFEEFGGRLWPPLLSTDCAVVAIPWQGRPPFEGALVRADLRFETVWIAKPRLPGLLLARMVSAPHARVILDHDDNEFHLSRLEGSRGKVYGDVSVNLVRAVSRRVTARTAASVTLAEALSAPIVRHARRAREDAVPPRPPA